MWSHALPLTAHFTYLLDVWTWHLSPNSYFETLADEDSDDVYGSLLKVINTLLSMCSAFQIKLLLLDCVTLHALPPVLRTILRNCVPWPYSPQYSIAKNRWFNERLWILPKTLNFTMSLNNSTIVSIKYCLTYFWNACYY